jgi:hypothetical protein
LLFSPFTPQHHPLVNENTCVKILAFTRLTQGPPPLQGTCFLSNLKDKFITAGRTLFFFKIQKKKKNPNPVSQLFHFGRKSYPFIWKFLLSSSEGFDRGNATDSTQLFLQSLHRFITLKAKGWHAHIWNITLYVDFIMVRPNFHLWHIHTWTLLM